MLVIGTQKPSGGYAGMHFKLGVALGDWIIGPIVRLWRHLARRRAQRRKGYR
jgi:hypothetical protein